MRQMRALVGALAAMSLMLTACGTTINLKSYPIESPTESYKRLRIGVPTAGAGSEVKVRMVNSEKGVATKSVIDPENILAIVQHEVMKSLQASGKKVALVEGNPDLDLQISFQAPYPTLDLIGLITLGGLANYRSLGGAKLVDAKTGKVLFTYEFVSSVRGLVPPTHIQDWEAFAKALAVEVNKTLGGLKLAENRSIQLDVSPFFASLPHNSGLKSTHAG